MTDRKPVAILSLIQRLHRWLDPSIEAARFFRLPARKSLLHVKKALRLSANLKC
jgi:hypothetical protein